MEPWRVINSQGNGPYAVLTQLGWHINGPLGRDLSISHKNDQHRVFCNRISLKSLDDLLVSQFNYDFPERACEEKSEDSVEDKMFLKIAADSVVRHNGHYQLRLPFHKDVT